MTKATCKLFHQRHNVIEFFPPKWERQWRCIPASAAHRARGFAGVLSFAPREVVLKVVPRQSAGSTARRLQSQPCPAGRRRLTRATKDQLIKQETVGCGGGGRWEPASPAPPPGPGPADRRSPISAPRQASLERELLTKSQMATQCQRLWPLALREHKFWAWDDDFLFCCLHNLGGWMEAERPIRRERMECP